MDTIHVTGIRAYGYTGYLAEEQVLGQWFEVRDFMAKNPQKADEIMAKRAGISPEELALYKEGTKFFTLEENLEAFSPGKTMKNMPFAAQKMADFMREVGFIKKVPDLTTILEPKFVKSLANQDKNA